MELRKRPRATTTTTTTAEVVPPRHRYPTRWKLHQDKANVTVHVPCKRKKIVKCTVYLPRDIIFNILLLVPATFLHQVVRYVCKQWNDIVNDPHFIKVHSQLSLAGLLVQNPFGYLPQVYYIEGDDSTEFAFPFPGRIYGSFNGLVLFQDLKNLEILSVINPLTKVKINLPPVRGLKDFSCIGFAITSCGHYKVVVTVHDAHHCPKIQVMVFTIGIDKTWRFIDLQGNSEMECIRKSIPHFIAGMLYWYNNYYPCYAMDVDTENIYHFPKPGDFVKTIQRSCFISLGTGLGLIQSNTIDKKSLWKLTDVKSGEWTELVGININVAYSTVRNALLPTHIDSFPVMLIDDMFWFNHVIDHIDQEYVLIRFNLVDQSFVVFSIKSKDGFKNLIHHVHTLLSPKKCYS
ncbi:putative F-box protein At3g17490 [Silene latifolia]|uniref:putative F-box protein At3g17490 n=1 Tax=Silene latifolia TaxID=37657 RepID=UPI003D7743D3